MPATELSLQELGRKSGIEPAIVDDVWATLATRYGEDHRAYHNLAHVDNMLDHLDACQDVENREAVARAIWFHDVICDPQSSSNEADSAILFRKLLGSSFDLAFVDEVARLIMVSDPRSDRLVDFAGELMADLDLLTLGVDRAGYNAYARSIRQEYAFVPTDAFAKGRVAVMERLLDQDTIYQTPLFAHLETPASANIPDEIGHLSEKSN